MFKRMQMESSARWIWHGQDEGAQTRLFRREVELGGEAERAVLRVFAVSQYHVWVNGKYVGRGPVPHHPNRPWCDVWEVTGWLMAGKNVLAVLVHSQGRTLHQQVYDGRPGLMATLDVESGGAVRTVVSDAGWKVTGRTGWTEGGPRRSWALGGVEVFDSSVAPTNWMAMGFDDEGWEAAECGEVRYWPVDKPLPGLRFAECGVVSVMGAWELSDGAVELKQEMNFGDWGRALMGCERSELKDVKVRSEGVGERMELRVTGLTAERGVVIDFDFGQEQVGVLHLECDAESGGAMDVGWAESVREGRPAVLQHGATYADRVIAKAGVSRWQQHSPNAGRYVSVQLRGFVGAVTLRRIGWISGEPALNWRGGFECDDERLNFIWRICQRAIRVGTQETLMDCPTREQACYVGDGHPVSRWIAMLSGDDRHWRYLLNEQFVRQASNGLIRSTVFSGVDSTLLDQALLGVIWTERFARYTQDAGAVKPLVEKCRRLMEWFESQSDEQGILRYRWTAPPNRAWELRYDPTMPRMIDAHNLFIDHPGMGWHNPNEPGIDRHGINGALHALWLMAMRAMAELDAGAGHYTESRRRAAEADRLRDLCVELFYARQRGVFVDGVRDDGSQLSRISQQTNVWMLLAGVLSDEHEQRRVIEYLFGDDAAMACCGPFFWMFVYPVLTRLGLHELAMEQTRKLWGKMMDGQTTTVWETFAGDDRDSRCHPWSAAPLEFLMCDVAGLPNEERGDLRPRPDLLSRAEARIVLPDGEYAIAWQTGADGSVTMRGHVPGECRWVMPDPWGGVGGQVKGDWELRVEAPKLR